MCVRVCVVFFKNNYFLFKCRLLLFCTATLSCPNPSRRTAKVDLDTLFKAANWEPKGAENDKKKPLEALTRQEWLEVVVRLAKRT
jgi:hypothetical protein